MQNTTADYKLEINKPSRSFECKITIGNNIYTNEDLVNLTLEYTQPQEGFAIGNTISQSLDLTLLNKGDIIYSTSQIKVEIGLKIAAKIEYILMGIFNIDDIEKTDYTTKFTAYDNMIKFETDYFSELGDKPTLKQVVNELSSKTGVEFTGSLPDYNVSKLQGFTCREVLSYVASICGGNAFITRDGKFTIKSLSEVEKSIDGNNYFEYTREEVKYKVGQISCQVDENNILSKGSTGTDSMELGFENPWISETILTEIYNKLKSVEYLGYSMKWQGDISLDPYDIITVTDVKNVVRKIPILSQKLSYTGGLTSEIGAKGETKNKNSFSSSGSTTNKVNRLVTEQAVIKEALIDKANIKDLEAVSIRTQTLEAKTAKIEEAIIDVAHISDLNAINANIQNLIAADATINNALIGKADITELNAVKGTINSLDSKIANIETLVNGNLSSENIQAGGITSDKLTIANGFITNAMIASLDVAKINAGDISTNKFRIVSDNGGIEIVGATQQFKDKNNKVRIQMGQDATGNFNFILRGEDGTTTLIDHTGIKEKAIADNLIKGNMVATDAIGEKQINYASLITGINKDTNTQLIKASKVAIDLAGQTLDVAFNSLKTQADSTKSLTESNSTTIGVMQGHITTAINNTQIVKDGQTVLLKDDYNRTVAKVDSINSTIGTHTTKLNELTGSISSVDTKVNSVQRDLEGTKSTVSSHTSQINGLNSTVSTQGASISQLQNQIKLKVEATDIATAINNMQIGGRNLFLNSGFTKGLNYWNTYNCSSPQAIADNSALSGYAVKFTSTGGGIYQRKGGVSNNPTNYPNGSVMTVSGYVKSSVANKMLRPSFENAGANTSKVVTCINANTWYYFAHTYTINSLGFSTVTFYGDSGADYYLKDVILEYGNKATTWTPAPEDIDSSIANVQTQVTTTSNKVATIETNLSSITQRVSSTESTVSTHTTQLGTVDSRINTAKSSAISTASSDATSKANNAQTNAINSAKSYTDGQITTVNKTITNKVAEIKTTTDAITQRVASTESKVTTITTDFNNLQIGVRNLFLKSDIDKYGIGLWVQNGGTGSVEGTYIDGTRAIKVVGNTGIMYNSWIKLKRNTTYVYSMMMASTGTLNITPNNPLHMWLNTTESANHLEIIQSTSGTVPADTWTKAYIVFKTPNTQDVYYMKPFIYGIGDNTVYISKVKVEEGNKATDWAPAPEDIDSSIANVQTQVTTTSNKVATIETNLNSITSRVSATESTVTSINGNVTSLQNRMSSAEQQITSSAIINTVQSTINAAKNEAINSANSSTDNKLKSYATTSSLTQTANNITAKFEASGGDNILVNGQFLDNKDSWAEYINNFNGTNGNRTVITPSSEWCIDGRNCLQIKASNSTKGSYGMVQTVELKRNCTYTLSGYNAAHRANGFVYIQRSSGDYKVITGGTLVGGVGGKNDDCWDKWSFTFTTDDGNNGYNIYLGISDCGSDGYCWYTDLILSEGDIRRAYVPNSKELHNGKIVINGDGINIYEGGIWIRNILDQVVASCNDAGWLQVANLFVTGAESPANVEIGGTGNKGIGIRTNTSSGTVYIDFAVLSKEASYEEQVATNGLHRIASMEGTRNILRIIGDSLDVRNFSGAVKMTVQGSLNTSGAITTTNNLNAAGVVATNLSISGAKNCNHQTQNYGNRLINAYETCEYYFGDLGEGIVKDGECIVYLDEIFKECVNTSISYHVFTQCYCGSITSIERYVDYFIVKGKEGTEFSWEVKAKRRGYEQDRLVVGENIEEIQMLDEAFYVEDLVYTSDEFFEGEIIDLLEEEVK